MKTVTAKCSSGILGPDKCAGETNFPFFGIVETDEEFAARSGSPHQDKHDEEISD